MGSQSMKALRLVQYGAPYNLEDNPIPTISDYQLLVKVGAAGFCHTDHQIYNGVYNSPLPVTPSHEPAGTIVAVGQNMLNFRGVCHACVGCEVALDPLRPNEPDTRFCENKENAGVNADGAFADLAGAGIEPHLPIGVIGVGGHPTVAIDNRPEGRQLASELPTHLRPGKVVDYNSLKTTKEVVEFAGGGGLAAVLLLRPHGVCVPLGLPVEGFRISACDMIFKELIVRGSLSDMMNFVAEKGVRSHVQTVKLEEAMDLPDRYMDPHLKGRLVVVS
ncbi:GroES-like protein [Aspergillus brunneoviolaceus CBS 621.78]|uniref:GroES-like protein n=1 Tax=Aspergillus brunneoviolaceus CBS 621.78 TaxID=1450534 RepID=A0ACD1GES8_9EURO|nr:GroES-like protein [Aspergillus brunneoviolaceus CBS 621.78]RAH47727.1 GroES-like protein [Aspergillus brunneoviolaceus CBS 621.78]